MICTDSGGLFKAEIRHAVTVAWTTAVKEEHLRAVGDAPLFWLPNAPQRCLWLSVHSNHVSSCMDQSLCILNALWQHNVLIGEFVLVPPICSFFVFCTCSQALCIFWFPCLKPVLQGRKQSKSCLRALDLPILGQNSQNTKSYVGCSRGGGKKSLSPSPGSSRCLGTDGRVGIGTEGGYCLA